MYERCRALTSVLNRRCRRNVPHFENKQMGLENNHHITSGHLERRRHRPPSKRRQYPTEKNARNKWPHDRGNLIKSLIIYIEL